MGISSSKRTNKPVYNSQIEGAGNSLTSAYQAAAPKIQQTSDALTGLIPGIAQKFTEAISKTLTAFVAVPRLPMELFTSRSFTTSPTIIERAKWIKQRLKLWLRLWKTQASL